MAKAVAARIYGDDYQARFFWLQACRLFQDRSKVAAVEIEAANVKSLDDVVIHYCDGMLECGNALSGDYYQVKFHVSADGAFTWQGMMDPAFINATSVSLLERIRNAHLQYGPDGKGCRFYIYSPWAPHPSDPIASLVSCTDGHIRWEVLAEGGPRSEMGTVRVGWRKHLGLATDEELRRVLAPLRLAQGPSMEQLGDRLNDKLALAGMKPVPDGVMGHPYEGLARKLVQSGRTKLKRNDVESLCRQEGLWIGKTMLDPEARRIGIRSFLRFAEDLEGETDAMLCLLEHFEGRRTRRPEDWNKVILPLVSDFLHTSVKAGSHYLLHLPAHGTIAFLAGWFLDPKSGADVALVQTGSQGRQVWRRPSSVPSTSTVSDWQVTSTPLAVGGHDVAVAISATHDIEADVALYVKKHLPAVSRIMHCRVQSPGVSAITDASHACFLSQRLSTMLKTDRTPEERVNQLHMFFAAPNSLVFFIGQMARSFGKLSLYEYNFETNNPGDYWPSVRLPPDHLTGMSGSQTPT
jgi:hypothetical protein